MIRQIIWDFDGVIIFSDTIREEGFREVLKGYGAAAVDKLLVFHRANGGLSRYVKFRYFLKTVLGQDPDETLVQQLAESFSAIMRVKMLASEKLNQDALRFIRSTQGAIAHYLASGSDGNELRYLCKALGIDLLFSGIQGSPASKPQLVADILALKRFAVEETCLIGDAMNDLEAARANRVKFFGYNNPALREHADLYLNAFSEFPLS